HFASGACLRLSIKMQLCSGLGHDICPAKNFTANQIFHLYMRTCRDTAPVRGAERPARDGPDVLLELRSDRTIESPMAGIMDARGNLIAKKFKRGPLAAGNKHFDGKHAAIVNGIRNYPREPDSLGSSFRRQARGHACRFQNMIFMAVLADIIGGK